MRVVTSRAWLCASALSVICAGASELRAVERADGALRAPSDKPEYHALDFWVGDWDVYDSSGAKAGTNRVESLERGCLITETWVGSAGGSGRSMNFYNPETQQWRQVWVNNTGNVLVMDGHVVDGAMRFEGTAHGRGGGTSMNRTTFTSLPGGRVRQTIRLSGDGGKTWKAGFDAVYVPKGQAFAADQFPKDPVPDRP